MFRGASIPVAMLMGALALLSGTARAQPEATIAFIVDADSVRSSSGIDGLTRWLEQQPDLTGSAVATLLDIAATIAEEGDTEGEAENLRLVEALATAHGRLHDDSAMTSLLAEYRSWTPEDRAARAAARSRENDAWSWASEAPDSALTVFDQADSVYAAIGDSPSRARIRGRMGAALWWRNDYEGVRTAYLDALERRRAVQDRWLESATLNGLGSVHYIAFSDLEAAAEYYAGAIRLRRSLGNTAGLGTSLTYAANVQTELGNAVRARELYEEALPYLQNPTSIVENLYGRAALNAAIGQVTEAIRLYEQAADRCAETEDCPYTATILIELADLQRQLRRVREAQTSLTRAESSLAGSPDAATEARMRLIQSQLFADLGDRDAARDEMVRAIQLARDSGILSLQCDGSILLSGLYRDLGAAGRARSTAESALELARELGDENLERSALLQLGNSCVLLAEFAEAIGHYSAALEIDERFGARVRMAEDLVGRGGAHSESGDFTAARTDLRRAGNLYVEAGLQGRLWLIFLNIADTFEEAAPDSAAHYYDRALDALERDNDAMGGEALNTGYLFAQRGHAYEEIARYYADRHEAEPQAGWDAKAFETAERSRARGLLDLFNDSFLEGAGPEVHALIDSISGIDGTTVEGRAQRERLLSRLEGLRERERSGAVGLDPLGLAAVEAGLADDALLLQYAVGDSASLLWIVQDTGSELVQLPGRAELSRRVRALRDAIAQPGSADQILLREARQLYRMLLDPAERAIRSTADLIIVPDDVLFELPFEVLLEADPEEGAEWSRQPFFGRRKAPVLCPSSTIYLELKTRAGADYDRQLLALGDADYDGLDRELEPLPFTRQEVTRIGSELRETDQIVLLGDRATEPELKHALASGSTRVVHLATHGLVDPAEPSRSCIALGAAAPDDGYLYSLEILTLPLQSPMVVLSACESALGRLERGEGVVGLTRSFLAAGAQGVIASLWPVSDASTAELMRRFYDGLWSGRESAARALRNARIGLMESADWGHPYFWSAFVVVGTERMPW
jgi:CHAT domain-containing protein